MDRVLEDQTLKEILHGLTTIGSFQVFSNKVSQLHHYFLARTLLPEQNEYKLNGEDLLRLIEVAEFLSTEYTNPLVTDRDEDLPLDNIPPRQTVQDALALAGTIFEFVADAIAFQEEAELNQDAINVSDSSVYYLKSALCYGLGLYESRTKVILNRIINKRKPSGRLEISTHQNWSDYFILSLLGRSLHYIRAEKGMVEQIESIRTTVQRELTRSSTRSDAALSVQQILDIQISLSLIEACILATQAFHDGRKDLLVQSQKLLINAVEGAYKRGNYDQTWIIRTISKILESMWINSPWERLGKIIYRQSYLKKLVVDGYVTFWSSQIEALEMRSNPTIGPLEGGYLDERIKRVVINMPTSAGKTLLAEIAIAHQLFLHPTKKCIYVAPYRALRDQVSESLNKRLSIFGFQVSSLISDNDISQYEGILFQRTNVIVVTPEKLNMLIRQQSPVLDETVLYVFDELHNICDRDRGWLFEEDISFLLSHPRFQSAKMVFISAIMPNHTVVRDWVDPQQSGDTVSHFWQPTRLLKGAVVFEGSRPKEPCEIVLKGKLVYVRHKGDLTSPLEIKNLIQSKQTIIQKTIQEGAKKGTQRLDIDTDASDSKIDHAVYATRKFGRLGPVLVYSPVVIDTITFCQKLAADTSFIPPLDERRTIQYEEFLSFIEDRLPDGYPLITALRHRIGFHHANLPKDVRNEVEFAFREGWIYVLAATSTLAQGVNLPVRTLLLIDYYTSRYWNGKEMVKNNPLSKADFQNMSGRAGRAMYETEGQVILIQPILNGFPYTLETDYQRYLHLDSQSSELDIKSSLNNPDLLNGLSRLVQDVDTGHLTEQQLLFEIEEKEKSELLASTVNKLHIFTLLLQNQKLTTDDEEAFVGIFQNTFVGKQIPNTAPQVVGQFSFRSNKALQNLLNETDRQLFGQTGLKLSTCQRLKNAVTLFWQNNQDSLHQALDSILLESIAQIIFNLGDDAVAPTKIKRKPNSRGKNAYLKIANEAFFIDWILVQDTAQLILYFSAIEDITWRAEKYIEYVQDTLGYKAPWLLSAFWIFSKSLMEQIGVDLAATTLGRELLLLPAYAKFGVHTPAAALLSAIGVSPAILAQQLSLLYESVTDGSIDARYNYPEILRWFIQLEPTDLSKNGSIPDIYIKRVVNYQEAVKTFNRPIRERDDIWEVEFPIAGWKYYEGDEILGELRKGDMVDLDLEPENKHDANAVIITKNGVKLGYVPRYLASEVAARIRIGVVTSRISRILPSGPPYNKVQLYCVDRAH